MPVTGTNVMVGPITVLHGLVGAAEPANADEAPGVGWTDCGGTESAATLTLSQSYTSKQVQQVAMPVGAQLTEQGAQAAVTLAELTLANIRRALNMAASAATVVEFGGEDLTNSDPLYSAIMLRGRSPRGGPLLWILRRTLSTENIGIAFDKGGQTGIPVTWTAYYVSSSIKAARIDDTPAP